MKIVRISKSLIIIILSFLFLLIATGAFLYDQGYLDTSFLSGLWSKQDGVQSPINRDSTDITIDEEIETEHWESPAGFAFDYNSEFDIDNHPEDNVNYANLDLTMPGKMGIINIMVNDTDFKEITDWAENDQLASSGSLLDTQIAGLAAKKVVLPDSGGEILAAFIDADKVIYLLDVKPEGEDKFWTKNLEIVLSSFTLIPLEGEDEDSPRFQEVEAATAAQGGDQNAIYMPEEIIE